MGSGASAEAEPTDPPKRKLTSAPSNSAQRRASDNNSTSNRSGTADDGSSNKGLELFQPANDLVLLPGDADAASLRFLDIIASADDLPPADVAGKLSLLRQAEDLLPTLPAENVDHLTVLLFHREGDAYHRCRNFAKAKEAYRRGIQIAELKVAEKSPCVSLMLQRYTSCILALSSIWFLEEQGKKKQRRSNYGVDDQRASETAILRCIELLELGLHQHSEHLLWPLFRLVDMYDELRLYGRALRYLRRAIGIVCQCFSYDHEQIPKLLQRQEELSRKRDEQLLYDSAVKLQSIVRMRLCMQMLSVTLQRRVTRHFWQPKQSRQQQGSGSGTPASTTYLLDQHFQSAPAAVRNNSSENLRSPASPTGGGGRVVESSDAARRASVGPNFLRSEDLPAFRKLLEMQGVVDGAGTTTLLFADVNKGPNDVAAVESEIRRRSKLRGWVAQVDE